MLEHVGGDHAVEAPESFEPVSSQLLDVGVDDLGAVPLRGGRVFLVELDAHHLDPGQERRQAAGRAAEVEQALRSRGNAIGDLAPGGLVGKCALVGHDMAVQVLILCGGRGSRLNGERPKPLIEIGGRPILWHVMSIYAAQGLDDFVLLTGYQGSAVAEWARTAPWRVECVDTGVDTPTGGRVHAVGRSAR